MRSNKLVVEDTYLNLAFTSLTTVGKENKLEKRQSSSTTENSIL